jgi:hypothetical protein
LADKIPVFSICPRCAERGYDRLRTHAYCVSCNYSPDFEAELSVPPWVLKYIGETRKAYKKGSQRIPKNGGTPSKNVPSRDLSIARLPMEMGPEPEL